MNYILIIVAFVLVIFGLVGAVVPGIAGPPFSYLGMLAISFVDGVDYSVWLMVVMGIIGVAVFLLDYLVPVWGTKTFGGTKSGSRGSMIGLIVGILVTTFFSVGCFMLLLGPFFGAYIGEKIAGTRERQAWRSAFGSFLGFLAGTFIKLVYAIVCIFFVFKGLFRFIW